MKTIKMEEICKHCNSDTGYMVEAGPHIKLLCANCNRYVKFLGKNTVNPLLVNSISAPVTSADSVPKPVPNPVSADDAVSSSVKVLSFDELKDIHFTEIRLENNCFVVYNGSTLVFSK